MSARSLPLSGRSGRVGAVTLLVSLSVLIGCVSSSVPRKRIVGFSAATTLTTTNVSDAFKAVEESYFQTQLISQIAAYDPEKGFNPRTIERFLTDEDISARITVLEALSAYAQGLADIMSDAQLKEFDQETKALGGALGGFSKNKALLALNKGSFPQADQAAKALATAVNAVGRWIIEYKRQEAVKEIVPTMNEHVKSICDLLIQDIGERAGPGMRSQLWNQYEKQMQSRDSYIARNYGQMDLATRLKELTALAEMPREQAQADAALAAVSRSLGALKETHGQLTRAYDEEATEIDVLIGRMVGEAKRIKGIFEGA